MRLVGRGHQTTTLAEARDQLSAWLPVLDGEQSRAAEADSARRQVAAV